MLTRPLVVVALLWVFSAGGLVFSAPADVRHAELMAVMEDIERNTRRHRLEARTSAEQQVFLLQVIAMGVSMLSGFYAWRAFIVYKNQTRIL